MRFKQRFFPLPGYVPKFYGYARVSHKNQADRGNSIADQEARLRQYYELIKFDVPVLEWGGIYAEPRAQSAFTRPFPSRPAGKELTGLLQPGDYVAVDKYDRMFRDLEDFSIRRRWFAERGISLQIVSLHGASVDANSTAGNLYISFLCLMAEVESVRVSERVSLARASRRASGRHAGTPPPFFCEVVDCAPGKILGGRLVFLPWALPAMEKIVYMRDELRMSFRKILAALNKEDAVPKRMPMMHIARMYYFYKGWLRDGRPDINTIKVGEYVERWKRELKDGLVDEDG